MVHRLIGRVPPGELLQGKRGRLLVADALSFVIRGEAWVAGGVIAK